MEDSRLLYIMLKHFCVAVENHFPGSLRKLEEAELRKILLKQVDGDFSEAAIQAFTDKPLKTESIEAITLLLLSPPEIVEKLGFNKIAEQMADALNYRSDKFDPKQSAIQSLVDYACDQAGMKRSLYLYARASRALYRPEAIREQEALKSLEIKSIPPWLIENGYRNYLPRQHTLSNIVHSIFSLLPDEDDFRETLNKIRLHKILFNLYYEKLDNEEFNLDDLIGELEVAAKAFGGPTARIKILNFLTCLELANNENRFSAHLAK